jgi:hypothetical protein
MQRPCATEKHSLSLIAMYEVISVSYLGHPAVFRRKCLPCMWRKVPMAICTVLAIGAMLNKTVDNREFDWKSSVARLRCLHMACRSPPSVVLKAPPESSCCCWIPVDRNLTWTQYKALHPSLSLPSYCLIVFLLFAPLLNSLPRPLGNVGPNT